jgi:hypothetical protein
MFYITCKHFLLFINNYCITNNYYIINNLGGGGGPL